jgi:hypothetical protein
MNTDIIIRLERIEAILTEMPDQEVIDSLTRIESALAFMLDALAAEEGAQEPATDLDGLSHATGESASESLD